MKNKITISGRISALVLAALMIVLTGCNGSGISDNTDTGTAAVPAVSEAETVMISLKDYKVIRPETCEEWEKESAVTVKTQLEGVFGKAKAVIETDWIRNVADIPAEAKEILVGHTNRPESEEVYASLRSDDSVVRFFPESGRIVIAGGSETALSQAMDYFCSTYLLTGTSPEACAVPADLDISTSGMYRVTSLRFSGISADACELVTTRNPDADDRYAASLIVSAVKAASGLFMPMKTDKNLQAGTLEIRAKDETKIFAICGAPAAGGSIVKAARQFAAAYLPADAAGEVDVTVPADPFLPEIETVEYPALADLGSMPVALADQLNASAVIYDVMPLLSGGQPELKWSFAPTSALGYNVGKTYGNRIDEFKIRYNPVLNTYVFGITSSSGFIGVGEYPSGKCIWNTEVSGWGPHSIEMLPNGNVAAALSGNGDETRSCVRVYAVSQGKNAQYFASKSYTGTHAVLWDDVRELLWVLGSKEIRAYEIGGTDERPTMELAEGYGITGSFGGHDMSAAAGDNDRLLICGSGAYIFNKRTGTLDKDIFDQKNVSTTAMKCLCTLFPDAVKTPSAARAGVNPYVIRTVAANVYASHDTDHFEVFSSRDGMLAAGGTAEKFTASFTGRAFYKARPVDPYYY